MKWNTRVAGGQVHGGGSGDWRSGGGAQPFLRVGAARADDGRADVRSVHLWSRNVIVGSRAALLSRVRQSNPTRMKKDRIRCLRFIENRSNGAAAP